MRIRPATSFACLLLVVVLVSGCGGKKKLSADAFSVCVDQARDRATAAVVEAAYRQGRLGSPAAVRSEIAAVHTRFFDKRSFLRGDGSIVPWSKMSFNQQRTFTLWWNDTRAVLAVVGEAPDKAGLRAHDRAVAECGK